MKEPNAGQPNKPKKKPNFLVRLLAFLLVLAVGFCLVVLVAFRDSLNLDSLKRWFTYRSLARSDSGQAESFSYDGDLNDIFVVLDGDLLVCSRNNLSLYSGSGTRYINQSISMTNPVVNTNGALAVVYDAGGSSLYVLGQRTLIWSASDLSPILSARLKKWTAHRSHPGQRLPGGGDGVRFVLQPGDDRQPVLRLHHGRRPVR